MNSCGLYEYNPHELPLQFLVTPGGYLLCFPDNYFLVLLR